MSRFKCGVDACNVADLHWIFERLQQAANRIDTIASGDGATGGKRASGEQLDRAATVGGDGWLADCWLKKRHHVDGGVFKSGNVLDVA